MKLPVVREKSRLRYDKFVLWPVLVGIISIAYFSHLSPRLGVASEGGGESPPSGEGYVCSNTSPCFLWILPPEGCHRDGPCHNYATYDTGRMNQTTIAGVMAAQVCKRASRVTMKQLTVVYGVGIPTQRTILKFAVDRAVPVAFL